jgi:hypothetical protein
MNTQIALENAREEIAELQRQLDRRLRFTPIDADTLDSAGRTLEEALHIAVVAEPNRIPTLRRQLALLRRLAAAARQEVLENPEPVRKRIG